jgi:hypothetical protein
VTLHEALALPVALTLSKAPTLPKALTLPKVPTLPKALYNFCHSPKKLAAVTLWYRFGTDLGSGHQSEPCSDPDLLKKVSITLGVKNSSLWLF